MVFINLVSSFPSSDYVYCFLFSFFPTPLSFATLTQISSDFLLTDLQCSEARTVLSLEFSHDMAAEGGAGRKSKIKMGEVAIRVHTVVNTVSLRVFLVRRIAVVTRQEKKGWVALET